MQKSIHFASQKKTYIYVMDFPKFCKFDEGIMLISMCKKIAITFVEGYISIIITLAKLMTNKAMFQNSIQTLGCVLQLYHETDHDALLVWNKSFINEMYINLTVDCYIES